MEVIGQRIPRRLTGATDDYQLVRTAVAGNQPAYAALLKRYQKTIFQLMLQRVKNPAEAEDLTMEAFEKAFLKLSSYVPTHAFSTWLFRIALNNCTDHKRKKRLPVVGFDNNANTGNGDWPGNKFSGGQSPEEMLIREQRIALIKNLLSRMDERYRQLLELRYYEEMSYDEIARELNLPLGTIKAQLFRARAILQTMLQRPHVRTECR